MKRCTSLVAALLVLGGLSAAQAQTVRYWDIDSEVPGAGGSSVSGTWDVASTPNWTTAPLGDLDVTPGDVPDPAQLWAAGDIAHFSAGTDATGASAITVSAGVNPGAMFIDEGRIVLSGTAVTMNTNPVRVNQGAILQIPGLTQVVITAGQVLTLDGGTIRNTIIGLGSGTWSGVGTIELTSNGGTFDVNNGSLGQYSIMAYTGASIGMTSGTTSATFTKKGSAEQRLRNTNTFTTLDVQGGLLRVDGTGGTDLSLGAATGTVITHGGAVAGTTSGSALGTSIGITSPATRSFVLNNDLGDDTMFALSASWVINGNISGPGGIMLQGWVRADTNAVIGTNQTLTLGGNNTFGGDVTINFGTIAVTGGNAIPDTSDVHISTTTTWGTTTTLNNATLTVSASETIATIDGGTAVSAGDAADRGNINLSGAAVVLTLGTASDFTYSGGASGTGGLTKVGSGTMAIRNYNYTNSGPTTINQGKIQFGNTNAGLGNASTVTIASGAELDMGTFNDTIGALAGAGSVTNGGNLTLNAAASTTFSGSMSLTGTLAKNATSTGVTKLTGSSNTIGTAVTIAAGKLLANNTTGSATGAAPITVNGGALGGTGSVSGAVLVNTGGHIEPGDAGIESLGATGGVTLETGSILNFDLGAPGTSDLLNLGASALTINGGGAVSLADAGGLAAGLYTLIDYGTIAGPGIASFLSQVPTGPAGFTYSLINTGSLINLQVAAPAAEDPDFNGDGIVDAADYVAWGKFNPTTGNATNAMGDANADSNVNGLDYDEWKEAFGEPFPGAGGGSGQVPEPSTIVMLIIGFAALAGRRRG